MTSFLVDEGRDDKFYCNIWVDSGSAWPDGEACCRRTNRPQVGLEATDEKRAGRETAKLGPAWKVGDGKLGIDENPSLPYT